MIDTYGWPETHGWVSDRVRTPDWRYGKITGINITHGIATVELDGSADRREEFAWSHLERVPA